MTDGGISQSSLLDRTTDKAERERKQPQDILQGLYLTGKYGNACFWNVVPLWLIAFVSLFNIHIPNLPWPDLPWLFKTTTGMFSILLISLAADGFYATLQSRNIRLWPIFGIMALAMAAALAAGTYLKMALDGFAIVNAQVAFLGGTTATVYLGRFLFQIFQKRRTFGSWLLNVGAALGCALLSAGASSAVANFPPDLVMVATGVVTGVVLLIMPVRADPSAALPANA